MNDGGSAFPIPGFSDDPGNSARTQFPINGMTLRDYFAAKAMQGLLAGENNKRPLGVDTVAVAAYEIADYMIKMREVLS